MDARIRHAVMYTDNYERTAEFCKTIFGMKQFTNTVELDGRVNTQRGQISDGVIGLAILGKNPGIQSGLDHFGFEVRDMEEVLSRIRQSFPDILMTNGFEDVPFAATRIHDPAGVHIDVKGTSKLRLSTL